jgi:hypothetical protein
MRGAAVAAWIGVLISWWQLRAALRESDHVAVVAPLWRGRPHGRHRSARPGRDRP